LQKKALIIGGSHRVWNVEESYNDVVKLVVERSRSYGIPTITGDKCWIKMRLLPELVKQASGGPRVYRTWHVEKSRSAALNLATFLVDVGKFAWFFNKPTREWQRHFEDINVMRTERAVHEAAAAATPWGFNAIPLPQMQAKVAEQSRAAREQAALPPISTSTPVSSVGSGAKGSDEYRSPPGLEQPFTGGLSSSTPAAKARVVSFLDVPSSETAAKAITQTPAIKAPPPTIKGTPPKGAGKPAEPQAAPIARAVKTYDWSNKMIFAGDLRERYS
jgi:hypothetical protein